MRSKLIFAGLLLAGTFSGVASATVLLPATSNVAFQAFNTATQGTLLASKVSSNEGLTFAGDTRLAVYQNTLGTLDFYYQFARTGAGTTASDAIETITGSSYLGYNVSAFYSDADLDSTGVFTASDNDGALATAQRNRSGSVVGIDFDPNNPVAGNQISATYIFRTDATNFSAGTFGVIDGSTVSGMGYQPAAVPEISTWAMMLVGFGGMGAVMRRRRPLAAWQA